MFEKVLANGECVEAIDTYTGGKMRTVEITLAEYRELVTLRGKLDAMTSAQYAKDAAQAHEREAREQLVKALRAQVEEQAARIATLEQAVSEISGDLNAAGGESNGGGIDEKEGAAKRW